MADELRSLLKLLTDCVDKIDASCRARNVAFPTLDQLFSPEAGEIKIHPAIIEPVALATTASYHFFCAVRPTSNSVVRLGTMGFMPACLRAAVGFNVPDILNEAGLGGFPVETISAKAQTVVDPSRLGRILRYLATYNVFKEVQPNVFANNYTSSALIKGKAVSKLISKPEQKYSNPEAGNAALFAHCSGEPFKAAAYLYEYLSDPESASSSDPAITPFTRALGIDFPFFTWLESPGNHDRLLTFGAAMTGITKINPPSAVVDSYDWGSLPTDSIIVDIGAGVGSVSMEIAKAIPGIKFVIQDRPPVIQDATKFWKEHYEVAMVEGRVTFQPHDFFSPQPIRDASVYLLRMVLHDWSDAQAEKILTELRKAARPRTQLVVLDTIIPYACADPAAAKSIPGAYRPSPPPPLVANMGIINQIPFTSDMTMLTVLNGIDRTLGNFVEVFKNSGWKIVRVQYNDAAGLAHPTIIADLM